MLNQQQQQKRRYGVCNSAMGGEDILFFGSKLYNTSLSTQIPNWPAGGMMNIRIVIFFMANCTF